MAKAHQDAHLSHYPNHHIIRLCGTQREADVLRRVGLEAKFCSHNCLADEDIYRPLPNQELHYDAIYDAQVARYKRHQLAKKVERLALICSKIQGKSRRHAERMRSTLTTAHWLNDPFENDCCYLSAQEVCEAYNRSHVGLCLSAKEGAMFASIQYLLCGLPVVSTPSRGGRDVFFDDDYVRIVRPSARAVRDGVREMIGRKIPPEQIRERTLERVHVHRQRYIDIVQSIYDAEGVRRRFADEWPNVFVNKMLQFYTWDELRTAASGSGSPPSEVSGEIC